MCVEGGGVCGEEGGATETVNSYKGEAAFACSIHSRKFFFVYHTTVIYIALKT